MQQIAARDNDVKIDDSISKLWMLCYNCNSQLPKKDLEHNDMVCPNCDYHFRIGAKDRIKLIFDENTFVEMFQNIQGKDPLEFVDTQPYTQRQKSAKEKSNLDEAVICGVGEIDGQKVATYTMNLSQSGSGGCHLSPMRNNR